MKHLVLAASAVLGILAVSSNARPAPEMKSARAAQDYTMIRTILNASPAKVSRILGAADGPIRPSRDCDYLPSCSATTYQHRKFEALFFKNRLKWLTVNQPGLMAENPLSQLGFRSCAPTFSNPGFMIAWRSAETRGTARGPLVPIDGIRQIAVFQDYALITVAVNYDNPF